MKIAIIGAGIGGLASIRYALQYGVECVAYEITENIGGTWVYYDNVENDEFRDQVPTGLYSSLRTNLPICLMEYRGYKFRPESGAYFPSHTEVLKYIQDFAREFQLLPHIKFSHKVINVSQKNEKWTVTVKNLKTGEYIKEKYDGVMVCSGHYSKPAYPEISGKDTFRGHQIHSFHYKYSEPYQNKTVLIVGKGQSALDIIREVARVANKVYWSHRGKPLNIRPKNITQKPGLLKIDTDVIYFEDGTTESVDAIIYCTGYQYDYSFIDATCEIKNQDMVINPLYKNFINVRHPTMCITGLLRKTIIFQLMDLQAEVFIKILTGQVELPPTEQMLKEIQEEYEANTIRPYFYNLGTEKLRNYFQQLYDLGQCKPFPPVIFDVFDRNSVWMRDDYDNLRNQVYEVIDDYTYRSAIEDKRTAEEVKNN